MVFSSTTFVLLFLPALLVVYYFPLKALHGIRCRNIILLLFSLGFYAWGEPVFVFVLLFSIAVNWFVGLRIYHTGTKNCRKIWLSAGVCFNVLLLAVFKYLGFLTSNLALLINHNSPIIDIALPIGISFFTFQMMSYIFDVYYEKTEVQNSFPDLALYVSMFPQLIAGPIVRYSDVEKEIVSRSVSAEDFFYGLKRFVYGLGKKVLLANTFGEVADMAFDSATELTVLLSWLGAIAYTLQIYYDFSGYSDMAIGLGRMFGFHFNENFNYPYFSKSVTEFWRRWHISLSSWFRDYVYIPLGGNRVSKSKWIRNIFTVWLLTGIWHGANWTFVLWGILYFFILLMEKLTGLDKNPGKLSGLYTMLVVILAWVIFRADNISSGLRYIGSMFGLCGYVFSDSQSLSVLGSKWWLILVGFAGAFPLWPHIKHFSEEHKFDWTESLWILAVFALSMLQLIGQSYNPFIYFNF